MFDKSTIIKNVLDAYLSSTDIRTMSIDDVRAEIIDNTDTEIELVNSVRDKGRKMTYLKESLVPYQVYRLLKELDLIHNIRRGRTTTSAVYIDDKYDPDYGLYKLLIKRSDEETYFYDACRRIQDDLSVKQCIEVLSYLKSEGGRDYKTETEDESLVAVGNGVVNVYEEDPQEHLITWEEARERGYVFTSKWYTDYNPDAQQPHFFDTENDRDMVPEDVLFDICGDEDRVEAVKSAMHAMLRPSWRVEAAMLLVDPNFQGNNGKSCLGELVQSLMGDGNYASTKISELDRSWRVEAAMLLVDPNFQGNNGKSCLGELVQSLMGDGNYASTKISELDSGFNLATLLDTKAIVSTDADDSEYIEHSGNFKMLTCNESMTIHVKYKDDVTTRWQGKIWASTNGYPRFREVSDAIDKRLYLIDCNTHFSADSSGTGIKKNKDIKEVFFKQKETLEYIFKMLLDLSYRELPVYDFQKQLKKDFRAETNPVDAFLNELTDEDVRSEVVEGWQSWTCTNPHWDFYPIDYLYLIFQGFYYQNYNKISSMSVQKFRISLRAWVKKNDTWELPTDSRGEMMRVSHGGELTTKAEISSMSVQKFRISLRAWVKKNDTWELPTDSRGEMMRVSHGGELTTKAESFTLKYMSREAGNENQLRSEWCNNRVGNAGDYATIFMPTTAKSKYTCIRRKKAVQTQEGDK